MDTQEKENTKKEVTQKTLFCITASATGLTLRGELNYDSALQQR